MKKLLIVAVMALLFAGCTGDDVVKTGSILGTVSDIESGEPINNVIVTLTPTGKSTTTGSDGNFEFIDLEVQQYKIQARHNKYKTDTKTVNVLAGETVRGDLQLVPKDE